MKKVIFLLVFLISGYWANSQITITIDSVNRSWDTEWNRYGVDIYSTFEILDDTIIEKGLYLDNPYGSFYWKDSLYGYIRLDSLYLPIYNDDFDTSLIFPAAYYKVRFRPYVITQTDTIYCDTAIIEEFHGTGLDDIGKKYIQVKVYPTIIDNILNIESSGYPLSLSFLDILGREVFSETLSSNKSIDCINLKAGKYICRIKDIKTNESISKKIIKQ